VISEKAEKSDIPDIDKCVTCAFDISSGVLCSCLGSELAEPPALFSLVACVSSFNRKKYLVPADLTMGQFVYVIRKRIKLPADQAIFVSWTMPFAFPWQLAQGVGRMLTVRCCLLHCVFLHLFVRSSSTTPCRLPLR